MAKKKAQDYEAYVGHNRPNELLEITQLAEAQTAAQKKVEDLEEALKLAKEALQEIAEYKLPEAMETVGLSDYTTTSGIKVKVKEEIIGTLKKENRPKGFAWLEKNGHSGLIKSSVVVGFSREQLEEAAKLVDRLRKENKSANLERKIEAQTLMAFIKEQLLDGKDIPLDIFSVHRQRVSKVTK